MRDFIIFIVWYAPGYVTYVSIPADVKNQNLLRKGLYYNYDYYHSQAKVEFSDADWAQRLHISESIGLPLLEITRSSNSSLQPTVWIFFANV